jgi:hypothetical protein
MAIHSNFQVTFKIRLCNTCIHGKCYKETPCLTILNKQKYFFFFKNEGQEGKTVPVWGLVQVVEVGLRKRYRSVNMVEITM